ncbi:MAG TPA: hypothetical protein VNG53_07675 [Bacteroidia bacterium]|nr:hypothetical protein [Bacteroidia bacterium]
MKATKLNKKYTSEELAESFVFRNKLTDKEKKESDTLLQKMRKKTQEEMTPEMILSSRLLQLRYRMEDYSKAEEYDKKHSFSYFLREYVKSLDKKNKDFANDIGIKEESLLQLLNSDSEPSDTIMVRLEIHSSKTIPALIWHRLAEKEKEYELANNETIRKNEKKHVKNAVQLSF